ncbi:TPA: translational GTPase TypA [Candidatus Saccharibacteria bacterium]|nr:translational GTPase TypA [Candidatus Saccharibacteria bacterium]HIO87292.1 translational GTPase TypA [Candidatus Saccharibacteria bacterium]
MQKKQIRNVAIVAHVDHGKTTLVDALLKQSQTFRDNQAEMSQELIMDSGDQEKERGITITAKVTAVEYGDVHINIIDTPGHADFGGEVERTLHMADGCLLIVDAQEGPMPQTKFVLKKAFEANLKPIVVINKIDKPAARIEFVENAVADLFLELATDDSQLHYPVYYAVGRDGKVWETRPDSLQADGDIMPLFNAIINHVPEPKTNDGDFQLLATTLQWDSYEGKYVVGKVERGTITPATSVKLVTPDGVVATQKVEKIYGFKGLGKTEVESASTGDIVALSGVKDAQIGQTIAAGENPEALPSIELEPPTLSMYLGPNTSPLKGKEGEFTTSRQIGERLQKELETNIGLKVNPEGIGFILQGRGELHLSVLIETMRREGFEMEIGRPQVVFQEKDGQTLEPFEEVTIEIPIEHAGVIQNEFGKRRGEMLEQSNTDSGDVLLRYRIATRNLLGARSSLITATKGTLIMHSLMSGYEPKTTGISQQRNGVLIAHEGGKTTPYALQNAEARGTLIVKPGVQVYAGQIVGLTSQRDDLEFNVTKEKHLTNMRSSGSDGTVQLTPATELSLEQCIDFLEDDELLEVTPNSLRLRKRELDKNQRKKKN